MENKIVIAGGSGFIGKTLINHFSNKNYPIVVLTRRLYKSDPMLRYLNWDGKSIGNWAKELNGAKAVINLAGKNINCRFTDENKNKIMSSRIDSVKVLGKAILNCESPPEQWIQASSIGYYGNRTESCEESSEAGEGFLAEVTKKWEKTFFETKAKNIKKTALRIGVVLGKDGGALEPLEKITKFYLGGSVGNGKQFISWIHIDDLANIVESLLEKKLTNNIYNAVSPAPVTNAIFMKALRKVMNKPWSPPAPEFAVKLGAKLIGTEPSLILDSSQIYPQNLLSEKFNFLHPNIDIALADLLSKRT